MIYHLTPRCTRKIDCSQTMASNIEGAAVSNVEVRKKSSCFNCGSDDGHYSRVCPEDQKWTRCPECNNVCRSKTAHKLHCKNLTFISKPIGLYVLPKMEFEQFRLVFTNAKTVYCAENTTAGIQNFLITKFFSIGPNIRVKRVFGGTDVILDIKIKPSVTLSIGRFGFPNHCASFMFAWDQIRINHYQHIDEVGNLSYSLMGKPRKDENHDMDLKILTADEVIFCTMVWKSITCKLAMTPNATTIHGVRI